LPYGLTGAPWSPFLASCCVRGPPHRVSTFLLRTHQMLCRYRIAPLGLSFSPAQSQRFPLANQVLQPPPLISLRRPILFPLTFPRCRSGFLSVLGKCAILTKPLPPPHAPTPGRNPALLLHYALTRTTQPPPPCPTGLPPPQLRTFFFLS